MGLHVDDSTTLSLVIQWKLSKDKPKETIRSEWDDKKFDIKYSKFLVKRPFFDVTVGETMEAFKVMDEWIRSEYKNSPDVLDRYDNHNALPEDLGQKFPGLYKHYWDILTKVNQNKQCFYHVLLRPIPTFEDLRLSVFSGYKVLGPFNTDRHNYFRVLKLEGKSSDMDKFYKSIIND